MSKQSQWYKHAIFYSLDVSTFQDSNGDGLGDFEGVRQRLSYIKSLGVDAIWILPFFVSPNKDNGYDVSDYLQIQPSYGTIDEFKRLVDTAHDLGLKIIIDLVANHTSNQHPWFQWARFDKFSRFHDYYIWVDKIPDGKQPESIFPTVEDSVWSKDPMSDQYYFHKFYSFEPELNYTNPTVHEEMEKIMKFWLTLGVDGFRIDAVSHIIERKGPTKLTNPEQILEKFHAFATRYNPDAVLIGEADVEKEQYLTYVKGKKRLQILFNFVVNNFIFLALARNSAEPMHRVFEELPHLPEHARMLNFLRNLDELDLERLTRKEREDVYKAFAPKKNMRIYHRGIRRRLAPMLKGDEKKLAFCFSLLFSLPGTPIFVYGDEIGMGEDLSLPERQSVRTAMQWDDTQSAGFSTEDTKGLDIPVIKNGKFSYKKINVEKQKKDKKSLLNFVKKLSQTRKAHPICGSRNWNIIKTNNQSLFIMRYKDTKKSYVIIHNFSNQNHTISQSELHIGKQYKTIMSDTKYEDSKNKIALNKHGFRWIVSQG